MLSLANRKITLPDGDFLITNWLTVPAEKQEKAIVLIFHGLGGSIQSHYVLGLMKTLHASLLRPIFVHFRGCSGMPNKKSISYHAGKTDDIHFVIHKIQKENPNKKIFVVGVSIGGSALLNYVGRHSIENTIEACAAVSVPYDLTDASTQLNKGASKIYQLHLLACQKTTLKTKFQKIDCPIDLSLALKAKSFYEFDDAATAPLHGFQDVEDYYQQCSSGQYLKNIKTPTLLIHAIDDPFMSEKSIPKKSELRENITFDLQQYGGHVGFFEYLPLFRFNYKLDSKIPDYFLSFL